MQTLGISHAGVLVLSAILADHWRDGGKVGPRFGKGIMNGRGCWHTLAGLRRCGNTVEITRRDGPE